MFVTGHECLIPANPYATPQHIVPEWYFLWVYAILRSIPNKAMGVVASNDDTRWVFDFRTVGDLATGRTMHFGLAGFLHPV